VAVKCGACGYEYRVETKNVDKVIYYKSGKRKGDVKEVTTETIEFKIGYEPFIQLTTEKDVDPVGYYEPEHYKQYFKQVDLYACPECGTVRMDK